jgi:glycosyltransferase 2 family protein
VRISRPLRIGIQLAVSAGVIAYLVWRIDLGQTLDLLGESNAGYLLGALGLFLATTVAMAWRWQLLLASKDLHEPLGWLTRLYFIGYAAGQILPTAVGGDAVRILQHARRRPAAKAKAAAAVVMERVVGSAGTLIVAAIGLALAVGRYENIRVIVWIEIALIVGTTVFLILVFSRRTGRHLQERVFPLGRRLRLERPLSSVYLAMHEYRSTPGVLVAVLGITMAAQLVRIVAIWLCGEAVGIDASPVVYLVLGPLLFLVQMVPVTLNGIGVREVFFVEFLGRFDVEPHAALAAGLLFYAVTIATALPGGFFLLWQSVRPAAAQPTALHPEDGRGLS